jgi:hypothetical protein
LFFGARKYGMTNAVAITPALFHLSVSLFFAGLIIFFFTIYKTVAIILTIFVGIFGVAYLVLTILPCIDHRCPYRTPLTSALWYLWQILLSISARCLRWFVGQLHSCLVPYNLGEITSVRQRILTRWLQTTEISAEKHGQCLRDGIRRSIVKDALLAPQDIDAKALTWLFQLPAMAERSKMQKFMAGLPGETIVRLFSDPFEQGKNSFRQLLSTLLRSCTQTTVGLHEDMRRRRLLVCLEAVHHVAKASIVPYDVSPSESVLSDVRINFANIGLMRTLWADSDPSIRITARSICALLAKHLLHKHILEESELAWLQEVMAMPSNTIFNALGNSSAVDSMNLNAYVYGVLSRQTEDLPTRQATSFLETMSILTNARGDFVFRGVIIEGGISALIQRADGQDGRLGEVIGQLRRAYERASPSPTPTPTPDPQSSNNRNRNQQQGRRNGKYN